MRKLLLVLALILLGGGFLAWQVQQDSGYVLISYGSYSVDMSVWAALLLLLLASLLWRLSKSVVNLLRAPGQGVYRRLMNNEVRSRKQTAKGMLQFVEGRWAQAIRTLGKSAKRSDLPLVNCMTAAYAAFELGDFEAVRKLLRQAEELSGGDMFAVDIIRAKLLLAERHYEEALAVLVRLHGSQPGHVQLLRMLVEAYQGLDDWRAVEKLLSDLARYRVFSQEQLIALEVTVYCKLLTLSIKGGPEDSESVAKLWQEMPSVMRRSRQVMETYLECLAQVGEVNKAEQLLRKVLRNEWDDMLVRRFGLLESNDPVAQLKVAEGWLANHSKSAELLLALGRICQRNQLWGKARDYFESSLAMQPRSEVYVELARLNAQLGNQERSIECYKKGLSQEGHARGSEVLG